MKLKQITSFIIILLLISSTFAQTYEASTKIVGVDNQGKGIVGSVSVEIQPGKGRVLVDTQPLTGIYTQDSERIAVKVTGEITDFDFSQYDVIYTIRTPETNVVEGPSAGGAMTVATIAAIEGKTISEGFTMTGTIQEDHSIGRIGGVLAKAKAAADSGVTVFLIPKGQAIQYEYVKKTKTPAPGWIVETIEPVEVNIVELAKEWGMQIYEVATIEEAMQYAFEEIPVSPSKPQLPVSSPITIPLFSSPVDIYNEFNALSLNEVARAKTIYQNANEKLEGSVLPDDVRSGLAELLRGAEILNDEADLIKTRGYRYSAGNNAFKSIVNSETIIDLADYYSLPQEARKSFLEQRVNEAINKVTNEKSEIETQTARAICDANKFEWAVAARERITYAENRLASIILPEDSDINITSPADVLFDVNIAEEWIEISQGFASKAVSNVEGDCLEKFKANANEAIEKARASVILAQTQGLASAEDGKWFLDAAEKEFSNGWYITAIYDATSSKVRTEIKADYEVDTITDIYSVFNKMEFATSDLLATIFFEHAQYLMYNAVKENNQDDAVEAITVLHLSIEVNDAYEDIKSRLAPGEPSFVFDTEGIDIVALVIGVVIGGVLVYILNLRSNIRRMEEEIRKLKKKPSIRIKKRR